MEFPAMNEEFVIEGTPCNYDLHFSNEDLFKICIFHSQAIQFTFLRQCF
jgi:hypothetical protein